MAKTAKKRSTSTAAKRSTTKRAAIPRGLPPPTPPRPDKRLKKIFVHSEGTFLLHSAGEVKKLVIKTPAFDVGGWIDLSKMAPGGDNVEISIRASSANRSNVQYKNWAFSSPQLVSIGDLGNYFAGTHIEFWVEQTTSSNKFATPVEYAYQFVVESQ
jgi:hypothetical protein